MVQDNNDGNSGRPQGGVRVNPDHPLVRGVTDAAGAVTGAGAAIRHSNQDLGRRAGEAGAAFDGARRDGGNLSDSIGDAVAAFNRGSAFEPRQQQGNPQDGSQQGNPNRRQGGGRSPGN